MLWKKHKVKISLPTIINRAKENNFYISKRTHKENIREVLKNYIGKLIQHHANLVESKTSWSHIKALENLVIKYGIPLMYYVDSHRIFRFVQGREAYGESIKR